MGPFEIQHIPPLDRATAELGVQLEREWDDELNDWRPTWIHWYPYGPHGREDACHAINWRVDGDNLICDRTDTRQTVAFHAIPETTSDSFLRRSQNERARKHRRLTAAPSGPTVVTRRRGAVFGDARTFGWLGQFRAVRYSLCYSQTRL